MGMETRSQSTPQEEMEEEEATEALDTEDKMVIMEEMRVVIVMQPMAKMEETVDQAEGEVMEGMEATLERSSLEPI